MAENTESASPVEDGRPAKRIRRLRMALSCTQCSSRKVKCDRRRPCSTCVARLQPCSLAAELPPSGSSLGGSPALLSNQTLHLRLLRLERAVFSEAETPGSEAADTPAASPKSQASETEDAVMALEDLAAGVRNARIKTREGLPDMFPEPTLRQTLPSSSASALACHAAATRILVGHELEPGRSSMIAEVRSMMPMDRFVIDTLVGTYFESVAWAWPVLYGELFIEELEAFHALSDGGHNHLVDPLWYSLLCSVGYQVLTYTDKQVLTLAVDSYDAVPPELSQFYTSDEWAHLPDRLHRAAILSLDAAGWLGRPSGRALQAVTMLGPYLLFSGLPRAVENLSIYVGAGIRVLQALRWHDRGSLVEENSRNLGSAIQVRAQAKKRVCYALASLDQLIFRYQPVLPLSALTCEPPRNYNDDDILDIGKEPRPSGEVTDATFELIRFDVARLCRQFHEVVIQNPAFKYQDILDIDAKFRKLLEMYDLEGSGDGDTITHTWGRVCACQQVHLRLMRIHRPFMSTGYREAKYLVSTRTAFDSAKILVQNERLMLETGARRTRGSFQIVHLQTAIVVIGLDAWHCVNISTSQTIHHERLIRDAVHLLREPVNSCREQVRRVARQTCLIAGLLLDAVEGQKTKNKSQDDYATLLRRIATTLDKLRGTPEESSLIDRYLQASRSTLLPQVMEIHPQVPDTLQPSDSYDWIFNNSPDTDFMTGFLFPETCLPEIA